MGLDLFESSPAARVVFERADAALGESLSETCFRGSAEDLALTENTQPAILTTSIAALEALRAAGVPAAVAAAGHSLGEYSAHVAAGTVSFEDAVRSVRARGRFMQEAVPVGEGAMAAVLGLSPEDVAAVCEDAAEGRVLSPANLNAPGQIVVAGHADAVARAIDAAKSKGARRAVELPVSAPFHCSLMEPAADRLTPVLGEVAFSNPAIPVVTNVDAREVSDGDVARAALLRQVASPVRWIEVIERLVALDIRTFVEVGPGRVLSGLVRRIDRDTQCFHVEDSASLEATLAGLGAEATERGNG